MPPSYSKVLYLDHSICCHGCAQIRASGNNKQACIRAADCRLGRSIDAPDEMLKRGHHRFPLSGEKKERKMQGHPDVCLPCRPELPSLGPSFANVRFRESEGSQMSVSKLVPAPRVRDEPARPWAFFPSLAFCWLVVSIRDCASCLATDAERVARPCTLASNLEELELREVCTCRICESAMAVSSMGIEHTPTEMSASGSWDHGCGPVRVLQPRPPPIALVRPILTGYWLFLFRACF